MSGSGAGIGMVIIDWMLWEIRKVLKIARSVFSVAVVGSTTRSTAGWQIGTGAFPPTASTSLASAWFSSRSQSTALSGFTYELKRAVERNKRGWRDGAPARFSPAANGDGGISTSCAGRNFGVYFSICFVANLALFAGTLPEHRVVNTVHNKLLPV